MSTVCPLCGAAYDRRGDLRWRKDGFDIVACPSCTLVFRAELPTPADLESIYAIEYFKAGANDGGEGYLDYVADEDVHRLAATRRLRLLARYAAPGVLLDVGGAAGFFVDEARRRGWDARGIDVAVDMVDWGREHLDAPVEKMTLAEYDAAHASLDAVTMWDYIEHSLDPVADFAKAHELIRPGGVVAFSTGDASTLAARLSGKRWHLLTPRHHNFYFTPTTLRRLLDETGFELLQLSHPGSRYPLRYLVHKARTLVRVGALDALTTRLAESRAGGVPVPLNLGDIATVVARRR